MSKAPLLLALSVLAIHSLLADVTPHPLFTDHMVVQQGVPLPVWGAASPGEKITVSFGTAARAETTASESGLWMVTLPAQKISTIPAELVIQGNNTCRIQDVLVGEVWLGSGQSNMAMKVGGTCDSARVLKGASEGKYKLIRLFPVPWTPADTPQETVATRWEVVSEDTARAFSATLFYFGEALQESMPDTPVGLICSAVGGTNAHAWIPPSAFQNSPKLEWLRKWYQTQLEELPKADPIYDAKLKEYEEKVAGLRKEQKPLPKELQRPPEPPMGPRSKRRPTCLYNGMIAPLIPYAIKGALWYQGENNASMIWLDDDGYTKLMSELITGWRNEWTKAAGSPEVSAFPFYIVQLPNFITSQPWAIVREQQLKIATEIPQTGLAVTIDLGNPNDIHPANKTPVGQRLALLARAKTYGEKNIHASPAPKSFAFEGGKAVVEFAPSDATLKSSDGNPLRHFELAGDDKVFHPATTTISNNRITVESKEVPQPVAVRYAWINNPEGINFYNQADLPASPFRSDSWKWTPPPIPKP